MKIFLYVFFASLLCGCSTVPIMPDQAKTIMPDNFGTQDKTHNAQFVVIRDKGFLGAGCNIEIFINQYELGELGAAEKTYAWLEPGDYQVTAKNPGRGICPHSYQSERISLKPNDKIIFRTGFTANGGPIELGYDLCAMTGKCDE